MANATILWGRFITDGMVHSVPCAPSGSPIQGHVESMNCWCAPALEAICTGCDGAEGGCWKCGGRRAVEGSIQDATRVKHVIHRNFPEELER
jgi:hypothetical protein